jgi:hypothetical protein
MFCPSSVAMPMKGITVITMTEAMVETMTTITETMTATIMTVTNGDGDDEY